MKSVGSIGSSTSWFMTTARMSERKMSVMEKHTPIAATARVSFCSQPRLSGARTLDGRLQADFLFGLVQKHHELGRGEKLALPHARGFELTLPKPWGGAVTTELKTDLTRFLGSGFPLRIDTMRGRCRKMSACAREQGGKCAAGAGVSRGARAL